jgi:hypothetical protein
MLGLEKGLEKGLVAAWTYLGNEHVAVVERGAAHLDEHVIVADFGDRAIFVLDAVEVFVGALDDPLLLCGWKRHCSKWFGLKRGITRMV